MLRVDGMTAGAHKSGRHDLKTHEHKRMLIFNVIHVGQQLIMCICANA